MSREKWPEVKCVQIAGQWQMTGPVPTKDNTGKSEAKLYGEEAYG